MAPSGSSSVLSRPVGESRALQTRDRQRGLHQPHQLPMVQPQRILGDPAAVRDAHDLRVVAKLPKQNLELIARHIAVRPARELDREALLSRDRCPRI